MGHILCTPKTAPKGERGFKALKSMSSPIILFLGKSRTGKHTMIRCLNIRYKLRHINVLSLIKDNIKDGTTVGHILEDMIVDQGSLVPRIIILEMLKQFMCQKLYQSSGFILEGYPRNRQQAIDFEKYIAPISLVIYLDFPSAAATKRIQTKLPAQGKPNFMTDVMAWKNAKFDQRTSLLLDYYDGIILTLDGKKKTMVVYVEVMDAIDELFLELGIQSPSRFV